MPKEHRIMPAVADPILMSSLVVSRDFDLGTYNLPPHPPMPLKDEHSSVLQLLAGEFEQQVRAIWAGNKLSEYLCATDARRHVWHSWLSGPLNNSLDRNRSSMALAHKLLTYTRGRDLIFHAYGIVPQGVMRALAKLGAVARSADVYKCLIKVLLANDKAVAKLMHHVPRIEDETIRGLAMLPPGMTTKSTLDLFRSGRVPGQALGYFCWTLRRLEQLAGAEVIAQILQAPVPLVEMRRVVLAMAFPEAPWPGTTELKPLRSESALYEAAAMFNNCLTGSRVRSDAVLKVLSGRCYFYLWEGEERALLRFEPLGTVGWYLEEIRGVQNRSLSPKTSAEIASTLTESAILAPVSSEDWVLSTGEPYWDFD
ncbi:hypothetical protein [Devosia psychrophila]|uniref:Uncharacterized protein n=3 Tax=Devosia psychrophila TaxID=728005 RepID=A0A1I1PEY7_9HYPH|nr:hypothetical protein [Devosia psychrophila]SFD04560.1 hypothetical protein SAMN04488059_11881 [Devosia psychrophila]